MGWIISAIGSAHQLAPLPPILMSQNIGPGCSEAFLSSPTSACQEKQQKHHEHWGRECTGLAE